MNEKQRRKYQTQDEPSRFTGWLGKISEEEKGFITQRGTENRRVTDSGRAPGTVLYPWNEVTAEISGEGHYLQQSTISSKISPSKHLLN